MTLRFLTSVPPVTVTLDDGTQVPVEWRDDIGFHATYRGRVYTGAVVGAVARDIVSTRQKTHASTARARALRAMKEQPKPALLLPGLEQVMVRGIAEQTGYALITREDGRKDKAPPRLLLRALDDAERAQLTEARTARDEAKKRLGEMEAPVHIYDAADRLDGVVRISYDPERGLFTTSIDGQLVVAVSVGAARQLATARLARKRWPYVVVDGEGLHLEVADASDRPMDSSCGLFETREAAQEYASCAVAARRASDLVEELVHTYRFDFDAMTREESSRVVA